MLTGIFRDSFANVVELLDDLFQVLPPSEDGTTGKVLSFNPKALNPEPLNLERFNLNPKTQDPKTFNPKTFNLKPSTRNPKPETLQPETRNPEIFRTETQTLKPESQILNPESLAGGGDGGRAGRVELHPEARPRTPGRRRNGTLTRKLYESRKPFESLGNPNPFKPTPSDSKPCEVIRNTMNPVSLNHKTKKHALELQAAGETVP